MRRASAHGSAAAGAGVDPAVAAPAIDVASAAASRSTAAVEDTNGRRGVMGGERASYHPRPGGNALGSPGAPASAQALRLPVGEDLPRGVPAGGAGDSASRVR